MRLTASVILCALFLGLAVGQPPRKEEEEDPKAKKTKPIDIESFPKPKPKDKSKDKDKSNDSTKSVPKTTEGPGVMPKSGVLVVGVRSIPELMSPTYARSDPDRWAVDLLFEGLVQPARSDGGVVFAPRLSIGSPIDEPMGRTFAIDPAAQWSDGQPVQANDVITSIDRWRALGRAELIGEAYSDSPRSVRLTLRAPHPDPVSVFAFRVMPVHRADDEAFARRPIGSGPFLFAGVEEKGRRQYVVFRRNPRFSERSQHTDQPVLSEVWFVAGAAPLQDLKNGIADLTVEAQSSELTASSSSTPGADVSLRLSAGPNTVVVTKPSRRIYFLAVNPLKLALTGDAGRPLRRAIAFAIQRETILSEVWRGPEQSFHRSLTGPFPTNTWSCDPDAPALDDKSLAQAELRSLKAPDKKLSLVFSNDDPLAGPSCERIAKQLSEVGISVDLRSLNAADYFRVIAEKDYDLLYRYYDFRNPWFDPQELLSEAVGGGPGLGRLGAALARCTARCEFEALRDARRRLHREFRDVMPMIPLWSPDLHIVLRSTVISSIPAEHIDPLSPLLGIETWRISR